MSTIDFTPEFLLMLVGAITSLVFSYFPNLNVWFAQKPEHYQKLFMLALLFVITVVVYLLGCSQVYVIENFTCDQKTFLKFVEVFIMAIVANQSVYKISPSTAAVRNAKAERLQA